MPAQAIPYVTLLGFFYGTSLITSRFSVEQFEPVTFIGLRLALAGMAHAAIYALAPRRRWPTDRRLWRHAIVLGVFGTAIPMLAIVTALKYQSGGITALLITANPALTVLLAHAFLPDESLTWRKVAGVTLALGGAAMLALRGESGLSDTSQANPLGYGLVLVGMTLSSVMAIYARRYMRDLDALDVASVRMWSASLAVMPLAILWVGIDLQTVNGQGYFALFYAAVIGTSAAFMLAFYNIKRFGATAAAMTAYIIPIVTGIGGVLLLGETITPVMMLGMFIIFSGVVLINQSNT